MWYFIAIIIPFIVLGIMRIFAKGASNTRHKNASRINGIIQDLNAKAMEWCEKVIEDDKKTDGFKKKLLSWVESGGITAFGAKGIKPPCEYLEFINSQIETQQIMDYFENSPTGLSPAGHSKYLIYCKEFGREPKKIKIDHY